MNVLVVGAGLMGAQIGVEYALGGHDVALYARDASAVAERVQRAEDNLFPLLLAAGDAGDLTRFAVGSEEAERIRAFRDRGLAAELRRDEGR